MKMTEVQIKPVPWDTAALGIECYEIGQASADILAQALLPPGHYTVRVDPVASKEFLHANGFYYCDSLIEPYCLREHFTCHTTEGVQLSRSANIEDLLLVSNGAFSYDRFHRDFNVPARLADLRYDNWLKQLHREDNVYGLIYHGNLAGFIGYHENKLVLHAMALPYRGKGLAKYFWSAICQNMFDAGYGEVSSSISATNKAALNLYASLGFRFRNAIDIYHRVVA